MRIVLDAMGGANAPDVTVEGAVETVKEIEDIEIILVGDKNLIQNLLNKNTYPVDRITIKHASQNISMDEDVSIALRRKRDSSIRRGIEMVKNGDAHAFVSAGHSGVVMATALILLGTTEGVKRPAIAATMPT